jgi:hypothetical protein
VALSRRLRARFVAEGDICRVATSVALSELLDEFARRRAENLATLRGWALTDHELALEGEHPEFGPVMLQHLLATWVAHDLGHLNQISRVMAKQ